MTFVTACNIIVEKIFAENRIRYAQRGNTLALLSEGVKLLVGVMMVNSELVIYRRANNTGKQKQQSTHGNCAMHTKMMI